MVKVRFLHKGVMMGAVIKEMTDNEFIKVCDKSGIDPRDTEIIDYYKFSEYEDWEHYHILLNFTNFKDTYSKEDIERAEQMEKILNNKMNGKEFKKNIVLYSEDYEPTKDIIEYAEKLGYKDIKSIECRLDFRFMNFIFQKLEPYGKFDVCKGQKTFMRRCSFKGFAYIREVDLTKEWTIHYNMRGDFKPLQGQYEEVLYVNKKNYGNNYVEITLY